jgi:hypothetical protein
VIRPAALVVLALGLATPVVAQARRAEWTQAPVVVLPAGSVGSLAHDPRTPGNLPDTYPSTYWKEGGIIGGVILGVAAALLIDGLCHDSDNEEHCGVKTLGGGALGAGAGFAIGSLVGGQFHKGP